MNKLIAVGISNIKNKFQTADKSVNAPITNTLAIIDIIAKGIDMNSELMDPRNALATLKVSLQLPISLCGNAFV